MHLIYNSTGSITGAIFYDYNPSLPAAWTFVVLFAVATVIHFIMMIPLRTWCFVVFILGGVCEAFGYYGRVMSHDKVGDMGPYMMQNLLILVAPVLLAATVYMVLGRIIRGVDADDYSIIRTTRLTKIFVLSDVLAFVTQMGGSGVQATGDPNIIKIGNGVVLGGLIFQLVMFALFLNVAARFHKRLASEPIGLIKADPSIKWQRYFVGLYIAWVAVFVRNLVRVIEYAQGDNGSIATTEAMLYIFDGAMMFITMAIFIILHPGLLIKQAKRSTYNRMGADTEAFFTVPPPEKNY